MCTHCLFHHPWYWQKELSNSTKHGAPMFFVSWPLTYIQGRLSTALLLHRRRATRSSLPPPTASKYPDTTLARPIFDWDNGGPAFISKKDLVMADTDWSAACLDDIDVCDWMEVDQGQRRKGEKRRILEMRTERIKKFPSSLFNYQAIVILKECFPPWVSAISPSNLDSFWVMWNPRWQYLEAGMSVETILGGMSVLKTGPKM